ncbi:MAG: aspartate aminotransferase [Proteobacteria bacterium]|nr:MAG: aspartate aminotransferase [Pseudomonadota bacterium]
MTRPISQRAHRVPASAIRKLYPLARAAEARGTTVLYLNIGQPDVWSPATAGEAMRGYDQPLIAYTQSQGTAEYVETLRAYYASYGAALDAAHINVTTGASEGLLFAMLTALDPGDEIIIPEPFYTNYASIGVMAGVRVVPITTRFEDGYHLPPAAELAAAITPRTKALLLCNPSNPTGVVYRKDEIDAVIDLCKAHDLWLFMDEVYREFVFPDAPDTYRTLLTRDDLRDRLVVFDSTSKRFSMCGARVGCVVSRHDELMAAILRLASARLSPPRLGQLVARAAHADPEAYLAASVEEYLRRRDVVYAALTATPGVRVSRPEGAFYTMVRLPVDSAERFAKWLLTDFAADGETVMVAPGPGFYATEGLGHDEVRIAYVLDVDRLRRAMDHLAAALDAYPGATR